MNLLAFLMSFLLLLYWGLNSGLTSCTIPQAVFCDEFFQDRV
jgi:hypothetical protein